MITWSHDHLTIDHMIYWSFDNWSHDHMTTWYDDHLTIDLDKMMVCMIWWFWYSGWYDSIMMILVNRMIKLFVQLVFQASQDPHNVSFSPYGLVRVRFRTKKRGLENVSSRLMGSKYLKNLSHFVYPHKLAYECFYCFPEWKSMNISVNLIWKCLCQFDLTTNNAIKCISSTERISFLLDKWK